MITDFHGHPAFSLGDGNLRVVFLTKAGPRIVGLYLGSNRENLLAELPEVHWETPNGDYHVYGGHRLWIGPETPALTYLPDDDGLTVHELEDGVELIGALDPPSGLQKCITISLIPGQSALVLTHRLVNRGVGFPQVAPWAISQLPLGGKVYLPQTCGAHPASDPDSGLHPNRHIVLWNYSRWEDPRLAIHDEDILLNARPGLPACKFGYLNTSGWMAYLREEILLVKRFTPRTGFPHPDRDCNLEIYCNDAAVELETLGPIVKLQPGMSVEHVERWDLRPGVKDGTFAGIRQMIPNLESYKYPDIGLDESRHSKQSVW